MGIPLQSAMKIGKFVQCEVVAGHKGLEAIIENITIMEVPDVVQWLKGNELLLTSLYSIKDDQNAQETLIKRLSEAGAVAIAIKPFHTFDDIPACIKESADELNFPVFLIPQHVKYLDILSPVMNAIFNEKVVLHEDLEQASKILNELSLNSQGIEMFISTLSYLTKNEITIESRFPFMKFPSPNAKIMALTDEQMNELAFIKHPIRMKRQCDGIDISCIVAPVILDGNLYGNITCWEKNSEHIGADLAILEKASSLLALEFLRLQVRYDIEQQHQNDFIRELLLSETISEKDLIDWGEKYRFNPNQYYCCFLLNMKKERSRSVNIIKDIEYLIQKQWSNEIIIGLIRQYICILFPFDQVDSEAYKQQAKSLYDHLKYYFGNLVEGPMGVGRISNGIQGIRKSFMQAEQSITLGVEKYYPIVFFDDLGIYRLLSLISQEKELTDFYDETVGKLAEYDENHDVNLVETLKMFFSKNENLKNTSAEMFIHVNTLKYRLQKIENLTGYRLHESEGKMKLYIGVKIHELIMG